MQKTKKEIEKEENSFNIPYKILVWQCPNCKDIVVSKGNEHHKLDECKCKKCFVDLEESYCRYSVDVKGEKVIRPIILFTEKNITFEYLREIQTWGIFKRFVTRFYYISPGGRKQFFNYPIYDYKPISKLSFDHILNILETQDQISDYLREIFTTELSFRLSNPSYFKGKKEYVGFEGIDERIFDVLKGVLE
jgi:hypothetical protein